ncbi:high mobility group nucleosome-binding domain-containing protein 5-like [Haliotis cracherodii]|uniref:high mobility group nucleosome-binding domain-containing protein 5-like n=1 Tax=Haliotis cracherodii TaxID=6455 RepID=UPI0039E8BF99
MMRLTIVLALVCFSQTVLSAPAVDPRHAAKVNAASKNTFSDPLELELQGVHEQNQLTRTHAENEAIDSSEEKEVVDNDVVPEVKRSERVSTDDVDPPGEDLDELSDNLDAADRDVKSVLRVFLHNLKQHPEIVEDIMEREGEKLLGHKIVADTESSDPSAFQKPSPQLIKIPKQVEKKAGGEFPRFIYKTPMRNTFERNQMTAGSVNNDAQPAEPASHNNEVPAAESTFVDPHDVSDVKAGHVDLSNAIPVIQQPNTDQDTLEGQINILPDQPEQNGPIDIAALQQAQDEYSRENPFINSLPLFPEHQASQASQAEDIVEPDQKPSPMQPVEADEAPEDDVPRQDTEIVNSEIAPEEESDLIKEGGESEEKRSQVLTSEEEDKEADTGVKSEEEDDQGQESESQPKGIAVGESVPNSPETKPLHHLTGSEIAANALHNPVESESSVPYYYYYYDYNKDGGKVPVGDLGPSEEGEREEEELENISDENKPEEAESETEEEEEDEHSHEDAEETEEEETDGDDQAEDEDEAEEKDEDEETGDETEDDEAEAREGDEEEDSHAGVEEEDHDEEKGGRDEEEEVGDESDESADRTNSHKVIVVNEDSLPEPTKQKAFVAQPLGDDENEADLLSLNVGAPDGASNNPDGPAM